MGRSESVALLAAAVGVSILAWWWTSSPSEVPPAPEFVPDAAADEPAWATVHVAGAVVAPGVVRLEIGARVIDAVAAAGGATADAVLTTINLAAPVVDGSQILVPSRADTAGPAVADDGVVTVNAAGPEDLQALPGVGPVLAARIIGHRDENGPFAEPEDLLDVPGIGESTLERLRPHIRIP